MKNGWYAVPISCLGLAVLASASAARESGTVPYPDGYRKWVHVRTALIGEGSPSFRASGGFHHIYANPSALAGLETGAYTIGSVFAFDRLEAVTAEGIAVEGPRLSLDVMVRDDARFAETGGWGFERFQGDTRTGVVGSNATGACFACHASRSATGFVFSSFRK